MSKVFEVLVRELTPPYELEQIKQNVAKLAASLPNDPKQAWHDVVYKRREALGSSEIAWALIVHEYNKKFPERYTNKTTAAPDQIVVERKYTAAEYALTEIGSWASSGQSEDELGVAAHDEQIKKIVDALTVQDKAELWRLIINDPSYPGAVLVGEEWGDDDLYALAEIFGKKISIERVITEEK